MVSDFGTTHPYPFQMWVPPPPPPPGGLHQTNSDGYRTCPVKVTGGRPSQYSTASIQVKDKPAKKLHFWIPSTHATAHRPVRKEEVWIETYFYNCLALQTLYKYTADSFWFYCVCIDHHEINEILKIITIIHDHHEINEILKIITIIHDHHEINEILKIITIIQYGMKQQSFFFFFLGFMFYKNNYNRPNVKNPHIWLVEIGSLEMTFSPQRSNCALIVVLSPAIVYKLPLLRYNCHNYAILRHSNVMHTLLTKGCT